jgi:Fe-S oxidoreductase
MSNFSERHNVTLTRQGLGFPFNRFKSEEVYQYLQEDTNFSSFLINLFELHANKEDELYCFSIACQDQLIPALIISKYIKKKNPNSPIILGGNIISRCYKTLIESNLRAFFDFLVLKEGEVAFCNLINKITKNELVATLNANAIYSTFENKIIDKTNKSNILNLDSIPTPSFAEIDKDLYFAPELVLPIFLSRGCSWNRCKFCGISDSWSSKYRIKSVSKICDEIEFYMRQYNCKYFRFVDESPALNDLLLISKEIIKRKIEINIEVYLNLSEKLIDENVISILSKAGIKQFFFGIESVNKEVLDSMDKNINEPKSFEKILRNTSKYGIHNYAFFLIGYPTDSLENEELLKQFIVKTQDIGTVAIASFIPVLGTKIITDKSISDKYKLKYELKGDLTNKCDYTVNGEDISNIVKHRTKSIAEFIMQNRKDIYISSKMPYETRFYMCSQYGNDFGKKYVEQGGSMVNEIKLSQEQEARALRK